MKLVIQIPCLNEEENLPATLADLPRSIEGVDVIEWLVVDDGSTDRTVEVARENGVHHIVSFPANRGLATAFRAGIRRALEVGADVIVNTDADNQYRGDCIPDLVRPIVERSADMVVGERPIWEHEEFGFLKKCLQKAGSRVVSQLARTEVPDVTSGFRAYSREAAVALNVLTNYTYTHETVIQAGLNGMKIESVPIQVNRKVRPSRLFRSIPSYIRRSGITILRIYTFYKALKVFVTLALLPMAGGLFLGGRFLWFWLNGEGRGHIQSLILCAVLLILSFTLFSMGVLADLIGFNRRLIEEILVQVRKHSLEIDHWPGPRAGISDREPAPPDSKEPKA